MDTAAPARLTHLKRPISDRRIALSLWISVAAVVFSVVHRPSSDSHLSPASSTSLERTLATRVLRAGYAGFPPYTIVNLEERDPSKALSGFCVDLVNEIASRQTPPWRVEWHKISWESLRADMYSGAFDVLADPVYGTPARAAEFLFTDPFSYFGVGIGLVRRHEQRFAVFRDLDRSDVTISLAEGWTSTDYAQRHLKQARLRIVPVGDDPFISFHDVVTGKADAALQDAPTTIQFARANPDSVKLLWADTPPMRVPASFIMRKEDVTMKLFLDTALLALQADGTVERIDRKWKGLGEYPALSLTSGDELRKKGGE